MSELKVTKSQVQVLSFLARNIQEVYDVRDGKVIVVMKDVILTDPVLEDITIRTLKIIGRRGGIKTRTSVNGGEWK